MSYRYGVIAAFYLLLMAEGTSLVRSQSITSFLPTSTNGSLGISKFGLPLEESEEIIVGDSPERTWTGFASFDLRTFSPLPSTKVKLLLAEGGGTSDGNASTFLIGPAFSAFVTDSQNTRPNPTVLELSRQVVSNAGRIFELSFTGLIPSTNGSEHIDVFGPGPSGETGLQIEDDALEILQARGTIRVVTGVNQEGEFIETPGGPAIRAYFEPRTSGGELVSPAELAEALGTGVTHFTWVNKLIQQPSHWSVSHGEEVLSTPRIDPDTQVQQYDLRVQSTLADREIALGGDFTSDDQDFYWNNPTELEAFFDLNRPFMDMPNMPEDFYGLPGDHTAFETRLVGVRSDGSYEDYGVGFQWKSNAVTDELKLAEQGIINTGYLRATQDIPILDGGIFDVRVFSVAESRRGDFDGDFDADGTDFLLWQQAGGTTEALVSWQKYYGEDPATLRSSVAAVPEPQGVLLLCLLIFFRTRRFSE